MASRFSVSRTPDEDWEKQPRRVRSSRRSRDFVERSEPLHIGIGNRSQPDRFEEIVAYSARDTIAFQQAVNRVLDDIDNQGSLLLIINGWRPWLEQLLASCIGSDDLRGLLWDRNKEVQDRDSFRFPERHIMQRDSESLWDSWSFVIDQLNIPETYWWSMGKDPPKILDLSEIEQFRFRLGVWTCAMGAYEPEESPASRDFPDESVTVTVVFIKGEIKSKVKGEVRSETFQPSDMYRKLFPRIYDEAFLGEMRDFEKGVNWIFTKLWNLLSDWDNIQLHFEERLEFAETNSEKSIGPPTIRTKNCHEELRRIYTLQQYLHFHQRSFEKLDKVREQRRIRDERFGNGYASPIPIPGATGPAAAKPTASSLKLDLKISAPRLRSAKVQSMDIEDAMEKLEQSGYEFDRLVDRFKNLTEYEFNMANARQAEDTQFLSIIATFFLPLSFLASIWGMTEFTGSPILYVYVAIPVLLISALVPLVLPGLIRGHHERSGKAKLKWPEVKKHDLTMIGDELPGQQRPSMKRERRVRRRRSSRQLSTY